MLQKIINNLDGKMIREGILGTMIEIRTPDVDLEIGGHPGAEAEIEEEKRIGIEDVPDQFIDTIQEADRPINRKVTANVRMIAVVIRKEEITTTVIETTEGRDERISWQCDVKLFSIILAHGTWRNVRAKKIQLVPVDRCGFSMSTFHIDSNLMRIMF